MTRNGSSVPAYLQIRQYVMSQIARSGNPDEKLLSVRELAKVYDVSPPTAMKALQQLIDEGVLISRHGVGTFINPNYSTRPERSCIGLLVSNGLLVHYDQLYMKILSGIYDILSETKLTTQLINSGNRGKALTKEIELLKLDGIIWATSGLSGFPSPEDLENTGIPVVSVNIHCQNQISCSVYTDVFSEGHKMAEHLLGLGHNQIIWAIQNSSPKANLLNELIMKGIEKVYQQHTIELDRRLVLSRDKLDTRLETIIDMKIPFTAVATTSEHYQIIYEVVKRKGLSVPEDVSIVTEDDFITCELTNPVPTRLTRPLRKLGETAAQVMVELINGKRIAPFEIKLDWEIIIGETCRKL